MDNSGELWQGAVERLGWGGQGITRAADGRLILLDAPVTLIPGEEVEARVLWKARHGMGTVTRLLHADPRRGGPPGASGQHPGYPLYGLPRKLAGELKRQMSADLLRRMLPDAPEHDWLAAPADALRSRIQLHWDGRRLGPHAARSNTVVELDSDPLAAPALSAAIPLLRDALLDGSLPDAPARWELATGTPDGDVRVSAGDTTWRINVGTRFTASGGAGVPACDPSEATPHEAAPRRGHAGERAETCGRTGQALSLQLDSSPLLHRFGTATLQQHPRAFFQACPAWAWAAFTQVLCGWELHGAALFDLYGGGGFFSRLLAGRYARSVLVESSPLSCADARVNFAGLEAQVHETDVARWLDRQPRDWAGPEDTVLLDPPRSGLAAEVAQRIRDCAAGTVVLVGCDGAAFCRDVRRITDGGSWRLACLAMLDLFPYTPEVECVGLLKNANH